MGIFSAFDEFQEKVDADPSHVAEARNRQAAFIDAIRSSEDVLEIVKSGSLERRTQLDPIHDVDLIAVFDGAAFPDWGNDGDSSEAALGVVHDLVRSTLANPGGSHNELVRLAMPKNRAVKCFVDDPDADHPFTVDVMPALRNDDGTLLIPSKRDRRWSTADPEFLIAEVESRDESWADFRPMVRVLKYWRRSCGTEVKSLVMETLALDYLPLGTNRPNALRQFFVAAAYNVLEGVTDPAGYCGPIQPGLDLQALHDALSAAGDEATLAMEAAGRNDEADAQHHWRNVFGTDFPAPAGTTGAPAVVAPPIRDAPQGDC
ncbi:nucleotidyltransferase [Microbacterium sp. KSW4-4]|uniref:SMODS domain-containing nucleotidyltransferase n=1 Tax=Microbacterium sp. KSW4-4 TaxID=2851651 RepID=UPI001FFD422A|nr:nucleotidyltransferase [Microbacterium sp. KSW4-4]MCK2032201.1 nucleotidyltransferase [Microbacterium sp. KSW4-4]